FSNNHTYHLYQALLGEVGLGCSFSPSGRFVYANTQTRLWQIDLDTILENSIDTVGFYDGYTDPFYTLFASAQLAPDGKIYLGEWNDSRSMHIINDPDKKSDACDFEQHSLTLPVYCGEPPNFVNYDLGPLRIYEADAGRDTVLEAPDTVLLGTPA